jgi:hypothetical protein
MRRENDLREQIKQNWWGCGARAIVGAGVASPHVTGVCHAASPRCLFFLSYPVRPSDPFSPEEDTTSASLSDEEACFVDPFPARALLSTILSIPSF